MDKTSLMEAAELKLRLFRQIDSLEKTKLQELFELFNIFMNNNMGINDWEDMSEEQREGIFEAINELDEGRGTVNEKVIAKYRKKYSHA